MSHASVRTRIAVCLLSCLVALTGCQDASKLVAPDVEPSLDLDGSFTVYLQTEEYSELLLIEPGGGNPQNVYATYPNSEELVPGVMADSYGKYVYVACLLEGPAWIKVFTGNGYWKIYSVLCVDQGVPV